MTHLAQFQGVYLLTPDVASSGFDRVVEVIEQALNVGVRIVQYRDKSAADDERMTRAGRLLELTRAANALLIVNDSVAVAVRSGADGVHLGRDDGDVAAARAQLSDQLLGVSCYNDFGAARAAIGSGADAVAFGSIFASVTKPSAVRAPLALLTAARARWPEKRIVAIGGINAGNIASVAAAGAHAAAVLDAVFGADNPAHAASELVRRFEEGRLKRKAG